MGDLANVTFRAGTSVSGTPDLLLDEILDAVRGGIPTYDFYSGELKARTALATLVGTKGRDPWTAVDDAGTLGHAFLLPGLPAYVATASDGAQLIVQAQVSAEVMGSASEDYQEAGVATMWMVTHDGPVDMFVTGVEKLGPAVTAAALGPALATLLGAFRTFVTAFFTEVSDAAASGASDGAAVASSAAETAAEEAAVDGEVVADELAVSVSFGPLAIVGLVVAALTIVLMIIAFGLAKTMTAWIRFFNATSYDVQLNLAHRYDLKAVQQPTTGAIPAIGTPPAPPGVVPASKVIFRADYVLQNDQTLKGLGFTLQSPPAGTYPGFTFMVDIPSVGHNSMAAVGDGTRNAKDFYTNHEGTYHVTTLSTSVGPLVLRVGTNQTSGESDSPLSGDKGFNYEYVMLLSTS